MIRIKPLLALLIIIFPSLLLSDDGLCKIAMTWTWSNPPLAWIYIEEELQQLGVDVEKVNFKNRKINIVALKEEVLDILSLMDDFPTDQSPACENASDRKLQYYARRILDVAMHGERHFPQIAKIVAIAESSLKNAHGLLLPGGQDVQPLFYGHEPHPNTYVTDDLRRDLFEFALLRAAESRQLPVFGICRGMQITNIWHGGTLQQHIEGHRGEIQPYSAPDNIELASSIVRDIFAQIDGDFLGGSWHHQAVDALGKNVAITAISKDGVIKALEHAHERYIVLLQWHPEELFFELADDNVYVSLENRIFFEKFAEACFKFKDEVSLHSNGDEPEEAPALLLEELSA